VLVDGERELAAAADEDVPGRQDAAALGLGSEDPLTGDTQWVLVGGRRVHVARPSSAQVVCEFGG